VSPSPLPLYSALPPGESWKLKDSRLTWSVRISGRMTGALVVYSAVFARYALAVTPKNYLLFGCHVINCTAQATQGYRWVSYWQ
jgi:hypothetical protein